MELMPESDLTVDEAMVKHNGRLSMKQFMPMKPVKRGIKVWECAEASSGFVCDFQSVIISAKLSVCYHFC